MSEATVRSKITLLFHGRHKDVHGFLYGKFGVSTATSAESLKRNSPNRPGDSISSIYRKPRLSQRLDSSLSDDSLPHCWRLHGYDRLLYCNEPASVGLCSTGHFTEILPLNFFIYFSPSLWLQKRPLCLYLTISITKKALKLQLNIKKQYTNYINLKKYRFIY